MPNVPFAKVSVLDRPMAARTKIVSGLLLALPGIGLPGLGLAATPGSFQKPAQAPTQETTEDAKASNLETGFGGWMQMQQLIGGEWHASEESPKPSFHRFLPGPGGASMHVETRDRGELANPLAGINTIFYDPVSDSVRGVGVASNAAFYASRFQWEGSTLVNELAYHIDDGSFGVNPKDGSVVSGKKAFDLIGRWDFAPDNAYNWELFSKNETGVASMMKATFTQKPDLTQLPAISVDDSKPLKTYELLGAFAGKHADQSGSWTMSGEWRAGCFAMWVERTLPDPFGAAAEKEVQEGAPQNATMTVSGFFYWDPVESTFKFLGHSTRGDLIWGTTRQNSGRQIESSYRITPVVKESNLGPMPKSQWVQLGETITPMANGTLGISWVLVAPGQELKVVDANLTAK